MSSPSRVRPKPCIALLLAALALAGCGGGLEEEPPPQIPAPETPTDRREARRVERALAAYRRDTRLIEQERAACRRGLPPGLYTSVCGPDVTPLIDQRAFHLQGSLEPIRNRVGPRCERAVRAVLERPVSVADVPLAAAARACRSEYETARERG
jgi:hypothetical protein